MLRNYLKVVLRILIRNKLYSIINVSGLAIGLACCAMILLFVRHELSYDRFQEDADSVYRVAIIAKMQDREVSGPNCPPALAPLLKRENPLVLAAARMSPPLGDEYTVRYEERAFYESRFFWADDDIFQVLSIPITSGDIRGVLSRPKTLAISETMVGRYFTGQDPIGKTMVVNGSQSFEVTAVFKDQPSNSHLHFDFLASLQTRGIDTYGFTRSWGDHSFLTYIRMIPEGDPKRLEEEINQAVQSNSGETLQRMGASVSYFLQNLPDIHLHSHLAAEIEPAGDIIHVYVYSAIAVFILAIAVVNFVNLTTALAGKRAKEVGVRKMVGARRRQLVYQLIGESVALSVMAAVLAIVLIDLLLPSFIDLTGREVEPTNVADPTLLLGFLAIALTTGLLAGIYPAFVQSGFHPDKALRRAGSVGKNRGSLRNVLVVTQFAISSALIVATLGISTQLSYVRSKHLGFDKENLLLIALKSDAVLQGYESLKEKWLQDPRVVDVAGCSELPGFVRGTYALKNKKATSAETIMTSVVSVDANFIKTMDMEIIHGRGFSPEFSTDATSACIVNESMAKLLGGEQSALGQMLVDASADESNEGAEVVGVVRDFHFQPMRARIQPLAFVLRGNRVLNIGFSHALIRIAGGDLEEVTESLKGTWREIDGDAPFSFNFMNKRLDTLYKSEVQLSRIFVSFATVAILIACLGLFALVAFATEQRTKEIGIRKVLGASLGNVVFQLCGQFLKLVLLANAIAWPVAYLGLREWLDGFAYRADIGLQLFLIAGISAVLIAFLTVAFHTLKAATANPVKALRYE